MSWRLRSVSWCVITRGQARIGRVSWPAPGEFVWHVRQGWTTAARVCCFVQDFGPGGCDSVFLVHVGQSLARPKGRAATAVVHGLAHV